MLLNRMPAVILVCLAVAACGEHGDEQKAAPRAAEDTGSISSYFDPAERPMTAEELRRARLDNSWEQVVQIDRAAPGRDVPFPERWEQISVQEVNTGPIHLPIHGDVGGPSVLRVQILLDRAYFSPGIMDGNWGKNTAEAVYWFQKSNGLPATARMDSATFARLTDAAGSPSELVTRYRLSTADVSGPFVQIPEDIYEQAALDCSCYESLTEKLSERFHATPDLLARLNPGVDLNSLIAGQTINAPQVRADNAPARGAVASLVVSGKGFYVHALDAGGRILYHFPSTLGATYSPSPSGKFTVTRVAQDPVWHYQPGLLTGVADTLPDATIPKGPNNAVGVVWIALSAPHYGIHGTAEPQTIGYGSSHGCIRLTNWDAEFLSHQVGPGIPVHFRDIAGAGGGSAPTNTGS
jgi:lipoprotein-anchoring transpeptidase ErfK/SrfK